MSQSDFIKYKKITNQLLEIQKLDPVLSSQNYIAFKQYTLESRNINKKPILNQLTLSDNILIFGMEKNVSKCSSIMDFSMCNHTQTRGNRVLNTINIPNPVNQHPEKRII